MMEQDSATVSGVKVHRGDFAYAPPGSEPSEWKLPIHDASHVRNALARFNQTELPEAAKAAVHAKIMRAARKFGIDAKEHSRESGFRTQSGSGSQPEDHRLRTGATPIVVLLTGAGTPVETPQSCALRQPGAQLREIAIAVPGSWVKGDHSFSITRADMRDMARNFEKRKNGMIPIDFEHASEMPEVAKGGAVPAAGWIHALRLGNREQGTGNSSNHEPRTTNHCLQALVEWTPQAEEMLRTGQYRFFSPAIDWGAKDKETGESQGATLTSGALTNHPFLEELPPIMLSDGTLIAGDERRETRDKKGAITMAEDKKKEKLEDPEEDLAETAEEKDGEGEPASPAGRHKLPMLKIRKGRKGSKHEGHHILSDGAGDVGCMSDEDFEQHAAKHLGVNPDENRDERQEARDEKQTAREAERHALLLTEVAKGGKIDSRKAIELADQGKITFADYIRAQEAEKLVDGAVTAGKILPRDRKFFFRDALERPAEFADYVTGAPRAVKLDTVGFGHAEAPSPDQEVTIETKRLMSESSGKLRYADAFRQVLSANPQLADRYRAAHSGRVNADGTAN